MLDSHPETLSLDGDSVRTPEGDSLPLVHIAAEMDRIGQSSTVKGVFAPQIDEDQPGAEGHHYLPFFVSGAHLAEVDVNTETGQVRVVRIVAAHDVGRVVNRQGAEGQVEGAILMSLGAALMEEYLPGISTGFSDYYLPTIRSMPEIEVILVEVPSRWGPLGAKGLGEGATLPTTPAICNGIYHATGGRVRQLPATAERVLAAVMGARAD
jgi:CO/xanthine dehydrogenase Mo-binding subunit